MVIQADKHPSVERAKDDVLPTGGTASFRLFGGSSLYQKSGGKGGFKIHLGLFGGSPEPPRAPITYQGGLFGGSKVSPEDNSPDSSSVNSSNQNNINGSVCFKTVGDTDNEVYEVEMDKDSKHYLLSSRREDKDEINFDFYPSSDEEMDIETDLRAADEMKFDFYPSSDEELDIETDLHAAGEKGQETGDALPALAFAATLQHSKDTKNEEYKVEMDKDSKNPLLNSCVEDEDELDDFTLYLSPDDTDTEEAQPTANEKKQESGDAFSVLASTAALHRSKDTKNEEYKVEMDKDSKNPLLNSCVEDEDELDDFTLYLSPDDTDTEEAQPTANEKKQESGDAFSVLASTAALHRSKDTKNEEYKVEMDKNSKNLLLNSCAEDEDELDDFTLYLSPDDRDTEEAQPTANEKKQESGDAVSVLASTAALHRSKDTKNEEYKVEMDKNSKNLSLNSCAEDEGELDDFTLYLSPDDTDTEEAQPAADEKKQENGDALSASASAAALNHSRDFNKTAINSVGRGERSKVSAFKRRLPGLPGVPSASKILISSDGAHLSWEPPRTAQGEILEYSVNLAVTNNTTEEALTERGARIMTFVLIYCGTSNKCTIPNSSLAEAYLEKTTKVAIIFRIAARNDKGYGPALYVRWIQGIPSALKIAGSIDGIHISWKSPGAIHGKILEYSVYLAVRNNGTEKPVTIGGPSTMAFICVYCGASNKCTVPNSDLAAAYIDTTTKAALIFRIAARNNKGYGPTLEVKWFL